jgi:hypothetical protein
MDDDYSLADDFADLCNLADWIVSAITDTEIEDRLRRLLLNVPDTPAPAGVAQWRELQPSKLMMRVRFPPPAQRAPTARLESPAAKQPRQCRTRNREPGYGPGGRVFP